MQRVRRGAPQLIENTWYVDGVSVDPGAATVTITRANGDSVETDAATVAGDDNARTFELTAADHTDLLDRLTVVWDSPDYGTATEYIEIVGEFYFTIADALALEELSAETPAAIAHGRTLAEQAFEDAVRRVAGIGYAFVPRYRRDRAAKDGSWLRVGFHPIRELRDATQTTYPGGSATDLTLANLSLTDEGIYYGARVLRSASYTIGFEYGYDEPPERVKEAVLILAKHRIVKGPITDRALSIAGGEGSVILQATPGIRGSHFGIPEVDAVVESFRNSQFGSLSLASAERPFYGNQVL